MNRHAESGARIKAEVLVIEDSPSDYLIIESDINDDPNIEVHLHHANSLSESIAYLEAGRYDLILVDLNLPDSSGFESFNRIRGAAQEAAIIVLTGNKDEQLAIEALRAGAQDYLIKGALLGNPLATAIRFAIERNRIAKELERRMEEIAAGEERIRSVIEANEDAVLIIDSDRWIRFSNPSARKLLELDDVDIQPLELNLPLDAEKSYEIEIPVGDARSLLLEVRMSRVDWEGESAWLASLRDVTENRLDQERIRKQAAFLDGARDAIVAEGVDGRIQYWNLGAEKIFGWSPQYALGRSTCDLLYSDEPGYREGVRIARSKGVWVGELIAIGQDGKRRVMDTRISVLSKPDGSHETVLTISTDVTDTKKFQEQLFRAQRLDSIGSLASGIAHDLNNVFSPMMIGLSLLKEMTRDPECHHIIDMLDANLNRGSDMVKQVLGFARGMAGKRVSIRLRLLFRELERILDETFPKNIETSINCPCDIWDITGDYTQIHQVLLNLCVNARDAMPDGGRLVVDVCNIEVDSSRLSQVETVSAARYVKIRVLDSGSGVPDEVKDRIFDPFFTTKEVGEGTGLGLSTSMTIVHAHKGFIFQENLDQGGALFEVYLPADELKAPTRSRGDFKVRPGGNQKIMIVDDELFIRQTVSRMLGLFGYQPVAFPGADEALQHLEAHADSVSVAIVDLMMRGKSGTELIEDICRLYPHIKVIASSGLEKSRPVGVSFLLKPYGAEELFELLSSILAT